MAIYREAYLVRIASDPIARLWSGYGDLPVPADIVEPTACTYLGAGDLVNVPDFQQLVNGAADRLDLVVSGVSERMVALAREDAASVRGAVVHIGRMDLDEHWQQIAPVEWELVARCDSLTVASQASDRDRTRSITLSIGTDDTNRSRAPLAFWTDADQRRRSPTDSIFSNVAGINAGTSRRFGPK